MACFENLPDELITIIFAYLPLSDRKRTRLVCRRFRDINSSLGLAKNLVTVVHQYEEPLNLLTPYCFHHSNIRMFIANGHPYFSKKNIKFWEMYGAGFKRVSMEFDSCEYLSILKNIFKYCSSVHHLAIEFPPIHPGSDLEGDCPCRLVDINMTQLPCLELYEIPCPKQFEGLLRCARNVKAFTAVLKKFNNYDKSERVIIALVAYLRRQGPRLKELHITGNMKENNLIRIVKFCRRDTISKLTLTIAPYVTNVVLTLIKYRLLNLEELSLHIARDDSLFMVCPRYRVTEDCLTALLNQLAKLTRVCLTGRYVLKDAIAAALGALPNLKSLTLSCELISSAGFEKMFGSKEYPKMEFLSLSELKNLTNHDLETMAVHLPNLRTLCLEGGPELTTDCLKTVGASLCRLEQFKIVDCFDVHCDKFAPSINGFFKLTYLEIRNKLHTLENDLSMSSEFLSRFELNELRVVAVTHLEEINYDVLKPVFRNCPKLEFVLKLSSDAGADSAELWRYEIASAIAKDGKGLEVVQLWKDGFNVTRMPLKPR